MTDNVTITTSQTIENVTISAADVGATESVQLAVTLVSEAVDIAVSSELQSPAQIVTAFETETGRDVSADGTKLDGIEAGATADQTDAEILSAFETETGRDVSADGTKLDGIESGATADQTGAEIKALYEGEADTNAFTDAEKSKLFGVEAGAEVNRRDYLFFAARSQSNGVSTVIASGTVYEAVFKDEDDTESVIYRHVTTATNARGFPVEDAYYSAFDGTNLTGLLAILF